MTDPQDSAQSSYYFIGIGGIGMSALAYILARKGYQVSGSDMMPNSRTRRLQKLGVRFDQGHAADNLREATHVVYSSAINPNNPEIVAALGQGLRLFHRSDILAEIMNGRPSIGVAGTHGKTTTSSMIGYLLLAAGLDPTLIIGGEVDAWEGNARLGSGDYLVAEVDESDGSLTRLFPNLSVITNIELDHPDHYKELSQVISAFQQYASQSNVVFASLDCPNVSEHLTGQIGYSIEDHPQAAYTARQIHYLGDRTQAQVWERGQLLGWLSLRVLGAHNLSNALAAVAVGRHLGLSFEVIAQALSEFQGAHRRFEVKGTINNVLFVDDYAHHPSEIRATLSAAKLQNRRVIAVFQPHRYSRLASLFNDFAESFAQADVVLIVPTYGAGETPLNEVSSLTLASAIDHHHPDVTYEPSLKELPERLSVRIESGDLVLFLGAGDLNQQIPATMELYRQSPNPLSPVAQVEALNG